MRLDEMMTRCGEWSIARASDCDDMVAAAVGGCFAKRDTLEAAIFAALNRFAERETAKYPWVNGVEVRQTGTLHYGWEAESCGKVATGDTIAEACEKVKPKPTVVTLWDVCKNKDALTHAQLFVGDKPVTGFSFVADYRIELKTEE